MKQSTRKSQARSTRQKPRQNNFQCTHAHGSRYCHKHMKECDLDCKESGTCAHCTNYHIPMTQYPCKRCEKLRIRIKDRPDRAVFLERRCSAWM